MKIPGKINISLSINNVQNEWNAFIIQLVFDATVKCRGVNGMANHDIASSYNNCILCLCLCCGKWMWFRVEFGSPLPICSKIQWYLIKTLILWRFSTQTPCSEANALISISQAFSLSLSLFSFHCFTWMSIHFSATPPAETNTKRAKFACVITNYYYLVLILYGEILKLFEVQWIT